MVANGIYNYREALDAEGKSYSPKRWDCYINVPGMKRPLHRRFNGTKRDCDRFCMGIRREAESGIRPDAEKVTVADFMGDYLRNRQAMGEFADSTIARYDWLFRKWIAPYIGGVPVKDVSPSMIERWYRKASSDGASGTTLNKAHRLAKMAFKNAVRDGLATSNKFDQVKAPKSEENKRGYLSFEEAGRMLNVLDEEEGFSGFSAAVRIGLAIGARRGEVLALTWNDIDFKAGTVSITKSLVRVPGARKAGVPSKTVKAPKTENSNRTITIDAGTLQWLRKWKREQKRELSALCVVQVPKTPICCSTCGRRFGGVAALTGGTLNPSSFRSQFGKFCERHQFKDSLGNRPCFHELRHTQATYLLAKGEDVISVSARLGHASPSITSDMYAHAMPQRDVECAGTIGALLTEAKMKAI